MKGEGRQVSIYTLRSLINCGRGETEKGRGDQERSSVEAKEESREKEAISKIKYSHHPSDKTQGNSIRKGKSH